MKSKRYAWVDLARIISIYFVLVIHSSNFNNFNNIPDRLNLFSTIIAYSGVPIFVMLSGFLLLHREDPYLSFYKNRLFKIIGPWLGWSLISAVVKLIFRETPENLVTLFRHEILSYWFLPMISGLYVITPPLQNILRKIRTYDLYFIIFLWFMIVSLLPVLRNTLAFPLYTDNSILRQVINFSGYYLIGYAVFKNPGYFRIKRLWYCLSFSILLVIYIYFRLLPIGQSAIHNAYMIFYNSPTNVVLSVSIFYIFVNLNGYLKSSRYLNFLANLAFGIYLSHPIAIFILNKISLEFYDFRRIYLFSNLVNALLIFIISGFSVLSVRFIAKLTKRLLTQGV